MQRPPYFDWRLDRWKIGLALLLWLGLLVFSPTQPPQPDPQGASPIARPGQRPVVGASTQSGAAQPLVEGLDQTPARPSPSVEVTLPSQADEAPILAVGPPKLAILESGPGPLTNNTPLFFGQTASDGLLEILIEGQRYAALADSDGYWQFTPTAPLPVGMTWVQIRAVNASGTALSDTVSQMALVGTTAEAVSAPGILTPLPFAGKRRDSTPYFSGIGPVGRRLLFYAQAASTHSTGVAGEVVIGADGGWGWQMSAPLPVGQTTFWAVAVDDEEVPLSRSWPVTLDVADDASPSVAVEAQPVGEDATR